MSQLTRETLLRIASPRVETVQSEAFGAVRLKRMSVAERDSFLAATRNGEDMSNFKAELLVRCICDESGNRLLSDADAVTFGKHPPEVVDPIAQVAWRLNGLGGEDDAGK